MRRDEAIRQLRAHAGAIRAIGATSLYLFGSTARDQAGEASDLDLFIDYDEDGDFSAIELVRLKNYISDALEIEADVTKRDGLHPLICDEIVAERGGSSDGRPGSPQPTARRLVVGRSGRPSLSRVSRSRISDA